MSTNSAPTQTWYTALEDLYGVSLDNDKIKRWVYQIHDTMPSATDAEITNALVWSATNFERMSKKARPDLAEVIQMIRAYRGHRRLQGEVVTPNHVVLDCSVYNRDGSYRAENRRDTTTMVNLKRLLDRRPPPHEAWNIICSPYGNIEQVRELRQYCDNRGIAYERNADRASVPMAHDSYVEEIDESEEVPF